MPCTSARSRRADLAIVINARLEEAARRERPALPVHRLEDPPLVSALTDADREAAAGLRVELDLGDAPVALYTGNFEAYQGVEMMAHAAALSERAVFVFVGGEAEDIAGLKARLGPASLSRCRFVGKQAPETLPRWMALADVLVSPRTLGGNTPFKIYTYLASGRPIVATRLDTHTQVLSDDTAFLVEPTAAALAEGIDAAVRDPAECARRAANGSALLDREYSVARYREKVQAAYAALRLGALPAGDDALRSDRPARLALREPGGVVGRRVDRLPGLPAIAADAGAGQAHGHDRRVPVPAR